MQVTDEMVEAGCQGRTAAVNLKPGVFFRWPDDFDEAYLQEVRASTRAALTAALPLIRGAVVEECAKEAEEWQVYFKHSGERASGEIAAAIRALTGDKP